MSPRRRRPSLLAVVVAGLVVGGIVSVIARAVAGEGERPAPRLEPASPEPDAPRASTPSRPASEHERERGERGHAHAPALPPAAGEAERAGDPVAVAERFALAWANRAGSPAGLRRQRAELVALSVGLWAREIAAEFGRAIARGGGEAGSEGTVVLSEPLRLGRAGAEVLVVTRERAHLGGEPVEPFHYATYLARLVPAPGGGLAVTSWEPQY